MRFTLRQKERLYSKLSRTEAAEYGGYLTPTEIVYISRLAGVEIRPVWQMWVNHSRESMKAGNSQPTWFYFKTRHNLGELIGVTMLCTKKD